MLNLINAVLSLLSLTQLESFLIENIPSLFPLIEKTYHAYRIH